MKYDYRHLFGFDPVDHMPLSLQDRCRDSVPMCKIALFDSFGEWT